MAAQFSVDIDDHFIKEHCTTLDISCDALSYLLGAYELQFNTWIHIDIVVIVAFDCCTCLVFH